MPAWTTISLTWAVSSSVLHVWKVFVCLWTIFAGNYPYMLLIIIYYIILYYLLNAQLTTTWDRKYLNYYAAFQLIKHIYTKWPIQHFHRYPLRAFLQIQLYLGMVGRRVLVPPLPLPLPCHAIFTMLAPPGLHFEII